MTKKLLCLILLCIASFISKGQKQTILFEVFDDDDGLPNNSAIDVFQDHNNVLWIGSFDGLIRYDGFSMKLFRHDVNDNTSISGNRISAVHEGKDGRLWVATFNMGINYTDQNKTYFNHLSLENTEHFASLSSIIYDISTDLEGRLWIAGNKGLHILTEENGKFYMLSKKDFINIDISNISLLKPKILLLDQLERMWIGTENGIILLDRLEGSYCTGRTTDNFPKDEIDEIIEDRNGKIWLTRKSSESRIMSFSESEYRFEPFHAIPIMSDDKRALAAFDLDNRLWVSVFNEQLYGYDFRDSTLFLKSHENSNFPTERFMRRPFVDHAGNVWIPAGRFLKYSYPRGFNQYTHPFHFSQENTAIEKSKKALWCAYREAGVVRIDAETKEAQHFDVNSNNSILLKSNLIQSMTELRDGRMAFLGFGNLTIFDLKKKTNISIPVNGTARKVYQDRNGFIWVGDYLGLAKISEKGNVIKRYRLTNENTEKGNIIQAIIEDTQGNIWFGSGNDEGLAKLDVTTDSITRYLPGRKGKKWAPLNVVDMLMDEEQGLWMATDDGLIYMNTRTDQFIPYTTENSLFNQRFNAILEDTKGLLWMSSNDGIIAFDPNNGQVNSYGKSDGLINKVYYDRAKCYADGMIYFGGKNGVDIFDPEQLRPNIVEASLKLLRISKNNQEELNIDSLLNREQLALRYSDDLLEIEFGATRFLKNEVVEYAYKMDGLVEDWVSLGTQRRVLFSDLRSGTYTFQVRAKAVNKQWSKEILSLAIVVSTPWWESNLFRLFIAIVCVSALYIFVRNREGRVKRKEQKEAEVRQTILELEKKALLAQMNPHFVFNSLSAIQHFMTIQDYKRAMGYLSKFGRLLRKVLSISSENNIPIEGEIKLIENYLELELMRYPERLKYTIEIDPDLDITRVKIPSFLIQPQVEQAIKNILSTPESFGEILISISQIAGQIKIVIDDNGMPTKRINGFQYDENEFNGTLILAERLKHLNRNLASQKITSQTLKDAHDEEIGTRIELSIDVQS